MRGLIFYILFFASGSLFSQTTIDNDLLLDMMQTQRYNEAASYIKSVFPGTIAEDKVASRLAYCYYMSGNLAAAEQSYQTLLAKDSTNKTILFNLAAINSKRGNLPVTKLYYQKILSLDSTNFSVYKQLSDVYGRLKDNTGLITTLAKANKLNPIDADVAYDYAKILIKKKSYPLAERVLAAAYQADSLNVLLIQSKMHLANLVKDYKLSVELAIKAQSLGDNSGQTINLLANAYYYLKRYKECIKTYSILELTNMSNESTFYYTSLAYRRLNNIAKSNEYLGKALKDAISASVPVYYQELSINDETLKRYNSSIAHLKKAVEFEDQNVFNYSQARIYDQNLANNKSALKYYKVFVKRYDKDLDDSVAYNYALTRIKHLSQPKLTAH